MGMSVNAEILINISSLPVAFSNKATACGISRKLISITYLKCCFAYSRIQYVFPTCRAPVTIRAAFFSFSKNCSIRSVMLRYSMLHLLLFTVFPVISLVCHVFSYPASMFVRFYNTFPTVFVRFSNTFSPTFVRFSNIFLPTFVCFSRKAKKNVPKQRIVLLFRYTDV